ncbi:class D sortase [Bacillus carboniphilus]|uniref:Class D sortase n=1 Tax=Bacillus carboniphilus TaxID=86663 RepID=A0ABY9JTM8_9BACI|nr:class D sortase [Bacillus carboniphilus]WLR42739.1 class D sortase [Bacillus carboniphilus]
MGKFISWLLIITGGVLLAFGGWKIYDTNQQTTHSLAEAKEIVGNQLETTDEEKKVEAEKFTPGVGDVIGVLELPTIDAELPIVEGTDPDDLEKGVGHYKGSYYPDETGQIVLSGHRDTVFRKAGDLKIGDQIKVQMPYGEYTYEILDTKIVDKDDTSIITLQSEKEELLITTCYPFSYVGDAPERYIIYAEKIEG